tara:strand:- start:574 stop:732 length:159 start_codon:yes stop_codon:yes gene_type:complete
MSVVIPPRLPEPPEQIDRQYMEDLVRALQVFISQQIVSNVEDDAQAFSWFTE